MFERFDGTGRMPRKEQKEALQFVAQNIQDTAPLVIHGPTGVGKQAIAAAIQMELSAAYVTTENMLVDQAINTYPKLNYLIGKHHYKCKEMPNLSCKDRIELGRHGGCPDCKFKIAMKKALAGIPTVYNAISYYQLTHHGLFKSPKVLIVDEAHKLSDMMMLVSGDRFGKQYKPPVTDSLFDIAEWLREKAGVLGQICAKLPEDKAIYYHHRRNKLLRVREYLLAESERYFHYYNGQELVVSPIYPPEEVRRRMLSSSRLILMSATLFKSDIHRLVGDAYKQIELQSPIPPERRRIIQDYIPTNLNHKTDPRIVAAWIKRVLAKYPTRNTIVHVSYAWSQKLKGLIPGAIINTSDNKKSVLRKFRKAGGVWLASGIAEGVDLEGNLCTLNMVPILPYPNIKDPLIQKRLALPDGRKEYDLQVLRTVIQQSGRSTRASDDYSTVVVGDGRFGRLIEKYKDEIPLYYLEGVKG